MAGEGRDCVFPARPGCFFTGRRDVNELWCPHQSRC